MMRMRRRSLVGAAVTTAAVVGTANAVSHHQQQKYAQQDAAQQAQYAQEAPPAEPQVVYVEAPAAPAPPPAAAAPDLTAQLQQLAQFGVKPNGLIVLALPAAGRGYGRDGGQAALERHGVVTIAFDFPQNLFFHEISPRSDATSDRMLV